MSNPDRRALRVAGAIDRLVQLIGSLVAWVSVLVVLIVFAVVALRYGFDQGSIALQEAGLYLHALLFMIGIAYTLKQDGHVRVDIFYRSFPPRRRAWVDLLGTLLLLIPFCVFMLWVSSGYVTASWQMRESSREAGGLPALYLVKTLIPLMAVLLLLQGISQALKAWACLRGGAEIEADKPTATETGV